jgi:hypothetical protein
VNINVLGVAHAAYLSRRYELQEEQQQALSGALTRLELNRLLAEVQPPLVLGSLEAVGRIARTDPNRAERLVARLATVLRVMLGRGEGRVTVDDEVAFTAATLELHAAQPGRAVHWKVDVEPAARHALTQPRALSLLVEHLLAAAPGDARLRLHATVVQGGTELSACRQGEVPPPPRELEQLVEQACGPGCALRFQARGGWSCLRVRVAP